MSINDKDNGADPFRDFSDVFDGTRDKEVRVGSGSITAEDLIAKVQGKNNVPEYESHLDSFNVMEKKGREDYASLMTRMANNPDGYIWRSTDKVSYQKTCEHFYIVEYFTVRQSQRKNK